MTTEIPERNDLHDVSDEFKEGAKLCEMFLLLPDRYKNKEAKVRLMLTSKFGGWKLKDELVTSLGLSIGDTISAEVSIIGGPGLIDENGSIDLFAGGDAANKLLEIGSYNKGPIKCIIDCKVKLVYEKAPIANGSKIVFKASMVLEEVLNFAGVDDGFGRADRSRTSIQNLFADILR